MLEELRVWMSEKVVPWMLHVYARGASNGTFDFFIPLILTAKHLPAEEARSMLQGVGSRFDFHINKTLCDLRFVNLNIQFAHILTLFAGLEKSLISSSISQIRWVHYKI